MQPALPSVTFTSPPGFPGIELVSVDYPERSFPAHSHPEYVVGAIVGGAERLEVDGETLLATAGTTILLNPGQTHANVSVPPEPLRYRVMYIAPNAMAGWLPDLPVFASPVSRCARLFGKVLRTHQALEHSGGRLEQDSALAALMEALGRQSAAPVAEGKVSPASIDRAKAFIDRCFASNFGLDELSGIAGLSRFHLVRSFKRVTGLSPVAYRNQRRIEAARGLLRTSRTITDIAAELGFADHAHLTRQFQRLVGTSPSRYREQ